MTGAEKEIQQLRNEAEIEKHVGFCFGFYEADTLCLDCPEEVNCLKLFIKEKANG